MEKNGIGTQRRRGLASAAGVGLLVAAGFAVAATSGGTASAPKSGGDARSPDHSVRVMPAAAPENAPGNANQPSLHEPALRRFTGTVGPDLSEALRGAGVPEGAARDYVAHLLTVERFAEEISVDDRFDLVVADLPGDQPMLVYAGMDRVGRGDLQYLKYGDDQGRVMWVDARRLEERGSGKFGLPVGGRVTSNFGTRMHPILRRARFHRGIDLAAASGTPVRAAADGEVARAGWRGGYGRQVALSHGKGIDTSYSHLSRIIARPGERVRRGDIIGLVGSSGMSTGPHLHFEAYRNGRAIDPRSARIEAPVAMSAPRRETFNGQLRAVLTLSGA